MGKFRKSERLCSRKLIGRLFSCGNIVYQYPLKMIWMESARKNPFPVRMVIGVSGKKIKKAVDRNRIKRLIRESYRKSKGRLYEGPALRNRQIDIALLYVAEIVYDYDVINMKMKELFNKFIQDNAPGKDIL
jgi:ribonuclease P protein component